MSKGSVTCYDKKIKVIWIFDNNVRAAEHFNVSKVTIGKYLVHGNLFLNKYYLRKIKTKESCLESELVSGFNTDYSGMIFVFFFLAEYSNIILISALTSIFFFGGFHFPLVLEQYSFINIQSIIIALKTCVFCFAFV